MAFTTWAALRTAILDDLADNPKQVLTKSYAIDGQSRSFQSLKEVEDFIGFCDRMIARESGSTIRVADVSGVADS